MNSQNAIEQAGPVVNFSPAKIVIDGEFDMWAIIPSDYTDGFIIGEWREVCNLYAMLKSLVETGGQAEEIEEIDERLGHKWFNPREASEYALARLGIERTPRAIRYACERGDIKHARKTDSDQWRFPQRSLNSWLATKKPTNV